MPDRLFGLLICLAAQGLRCPCVGTLYNIGGRNKSRIFVNYFAGAETFDEVFRLCASLSKAP